MNTSVNAIGAVDIGGTKIAVGLVDERGRVLTRRDLSTEPEAGFDAAMTRVVATLTRAVHETGSTLTGIGIGATGPIDPIGGAFGHVPFFPRWEGGNPVTTLAGAFGVQVAAENDGDAGALAEAAWGAGRGMSRFLFVCVGTGIGGGSVLDGRLYRGAGGSHPEVGHHIVEASGPPCSCGAVGCWEALAAGPAIAEWFDAHVPQASRSAETTAKDVCDLAREGHPVALQAVEREGFYLGVGLANLITLFGPDVIALGGSVMRSYDLFRDPVHRTIRRLCTFVPWNDRTIRMAELGADAGLIGAAEVWRHRFNTGNAIS